MARRMRHLAGLALAIGLPLGMGAGAIAHPAHASKAPPAKPLAERFPPQVVYQGALYPEATPAPKAPQVALAPTPAPSHGHLPTWLIGLTLPPAALLFWRNKQRRFDTYLDELEPEVDEVLPEAPEAAPTEPAVSPRLSNPFADARQVASPASTDQDVVAALYASEARLTGAFAEQQAWFRRLDTQLQRWERGREEDRQAFRTDVEALGARLDAQMQRWERGREEDRQAVRNEVGGLDARLANDLQGLRTEWQDGYEALEERLQGLEAELRDRDSKVAGLERQLSRMDSLSGRLDEFEREFAFGQRQIDRKFEQHLILAERQREQGVGRLADRLDAVQAEVRALAAAPPPMREVAMQAETLQAVANQQDQHQRAIAQLTRILAGQRTQIASLAASQQATVQAVDAQGVRMQQVVDLLSRLHAGPTRPVPTPPASVR